MKKFFAALIHPTAYDSTFILLYISVLGSIFPALIPVIDTGTSFVFVSLPVLLVLPVCRLWLRFFPPKHPRLVQLLLSCVVTIFFAFDLYSIFRLSYALSFFL